MNARTGSGQLGADFGAKAIEIPRPRRLWQQAWVRWILVGAVLATILVAAVLLALGYDWRRSQLADIARQRRSFAAFLSSAEFAQFARAADAQFVALNNFIAARPTVARDALAGGSGPAPRDRHTLSWPFEVTPVPISTAGDPARVLAAHRAIQVQLTRDHFHFAADAEREARTTFLRVLAPYAGAFLHRAPENGFNALPLDREMQVAGLDAFASRHGPGATLSDAERMFALYAKIGPAMWQAIEADRHRVNPSAPAARLQ